jgi:hypothetical protein
MLTILFLFEEYFLGLSMLIYGLKLELPFELAELLWKCFRFILYGLKLEFELELAGLPTKFFLLCPFQFPPPPPPLLMLFTGLLELSGIKSKLCGSGEPLKGELPCLAEN